MDMRKCAAGKTIAATVLLALSGAAAAEQAPGFYIGALAGQSTTKDISQSDLDGLMFSEFGPIGRSSFDDTDSSFGVFGGYRFFPWLAVEAAYQDLGEASYSADVPVFVPPSVVNVRTDITTAVKAFSASALFMLPLSDQFSVGLRAGIATSSAKLSVRASAFGVSESESDTETNTSGVFGVHAEWNPTQQLGVRIEFQRYLDVAGDYEDDIDGYDVDLLSAGLIWRF